MDFSGIAHWIFALCSFILLYTMLFGTFRVWQVTGSFCITHEQKQGDIYTSISLLPNLEPRSHSVLL